MEKLPGTPALTRANANRRSAWGRTKFPAAAPACRPVPRHPADPGAFFRKMRPSLRAWLFYTTYILHRRANFKKSRPPESGKTLRRVWAGGRAAFLRRAGGARRKTAGCGASSGLREHRAGTGGGAADGIPRMPPRRTGPNFLLEFSARPCIIKLCAVCLIGMPAHRNPPNGFRAKGRPFRF